MEQTPAYTARLRARIQERAHVLGYLKPGQNIAWRFFQETAQQFGTVLRAATPLLRSAVPGTPLGRVATFPEPDILFLWFDGLLLPRELTQVQELVTWLDAQLAPTVYGELARQLHVLVEMLLHAQAEMQSA